MTTTTATTTAPPTPPGDKILTFCCDRDRYGHPLLWCEERRRLLQRQNAEECLRMWRRRKAEEIARKEKEKREYYELCLKHCPWGRPGGGAPNQEIRRKDITALGLHSTAMIPSATTHCFPSLRRCFYRDYFLTHNTAYPHNLGTGLQHHAETPANPNSSKQTAHRQGDRAKIQNYKTKETELASKTHRKNSEALQITLKNVHPSGREQISIEVRYRNHTNGKPLLKKIVLTENNDNKGQTPAKITDAAKVEDTQNETPRPLEQTKQPGSIFRKKEEAVGNAWSSPKSMGKFMKSLGWTNNEMLKELDQDNPVTPAEKHTFRKVRPSKNLKRCCASCVCKCPIPGTTSPTCLRSLPKKSSTHSKNPSNQNSIIKEESIKLSDNNSTDLCGAGGGIELIPLLARRRAPSRPISLSSTDVTKCSIGNERLSASVSPSYLHELNEQISEKLHSNNAMVELDKVLSSKHFERFDTFWGRPGHGAPIERKTKFKLDNLIYGDGAQHFSG